MRYPAYPGIVIGQPRTRQPLQEVYEHLPVTHGVSESDGHPEVACICGEPHQVGGDPLHLDRHDPDVLRPLWHIDVHEVLDREAVQVGPSHRRTVAEPVGDGDYLRICQSLADLLDASVKVAHLGFGIDDRLAVDLHPQVPKPVRHRVLGAHVDPHFSHARSPLEVLSQRMVHHVLRKQYPLQLRVALEHHTHEVVGFPLLPVGSAPN